MPPTDEPPRPTAGARVLVPAGESGAAAGDAQPSVRAATSEAVEAAEEFVAHESVAHQAIAQESRAQESRAQESRAHASVAQEPAGQQSGSTRHGAHPHRMLREAAADRWKWRAAIRRSPTKRRIYRMAVAFAGLLLIALGIVSGPIPGPGGIPLVLLGLAVWSSEFVWARRLLRLFKRQLRRFQSWTRPQQTLAWLAFFAVCGLFGYSYLLILGPPGWLPAPVDTLLARLPGI